MKLNEYVTTINVKTKEILKHNDEIINISNLIYSKMINKNSRIFFVGANYSGTIAKTLLDKLWFLFDEPKNKYFVIVSAITHQKDKWNTCEDSLKYYVNQENFYQIGYLDAQNFNFTSNDIVIELSVTGETPYNHGFISRAKELGAETVSIFIMNSNQNQLANTIINFNMDNPIVAGFHIGQDQIIFKIVIDFIFLNAFEKRGKIYNNQLVSINAFSYKMQLIAIKNISNILQITSEEARKLLEENNNLTSCALISFLYKINFFEAQQLIKKNKFNISLLITKKIGEKK